MIGTVLLIMAFICFIISTVAVLRPAWESWRSLLGLGLALWVLSILIRGASTLR